MASDTYTLEVLADVSRYAEGMGKIPGITDRQVAAATLKFQNRLFSVQKAAEKAGKKTAEAGWEGAEKKLAATGEASEKLAGALGLVSPAASIAVSSAGKLGKALSLFASPAGVAVAVVGALALGAGALGVALVESAFEADDALKSLEGFKRIGSDFYPSVPANTLDSIKQLNSAGDALTSIFEKAVVALGSEVAPSLETVANVAVGAALAGEQLFEEFLQGTNATKELVVWLGSKLVSAATTPLVPLQRLAQGILLAAQASGVDLPDGAKVALDKLADLNTTISASVVEYAESAVAGSHLGDVLTGLDKRGSAFIHTQRRATAATKDQKKETYDLVSALDKLSAQAQAADDSRLTGFGKLRAERDRELADVDASVSAEAEAAVKKGATWADLTRLFAQAEVTKQRISADSEAKIQDLQRTTRDKFLDGMEAANRTYMEKLKARDAAAKALEESLQDANDRTRDNTFATVDSLSGAYSELFGNISDAIGESNEKAATSAYAISQGLALVQTTFAAYKAAAETAAAVAAIPGGQPFAIPAGIAMFAAMEGAFVAKVAAQDPPTFHVGGVISSVPDLAPDEVMVRARRGEGFLTSRGVDAAGGPAGVAALNRGSWGPAPSVSVSLRVTGRTAQKLVQVGTDEPTRRGKPATGQRPRNRSR